MTATVDAVKPSVVALRSRRWIGVESSAGQLGLLNAVYSDSSFRVMGVIFIDGNGMMDGVLDVKEDGWR